MKFRIELVADARVSTAVEVEAGSLRAAQELALQRAKQGDVVWNYDGAETETIELGK